MSTDNHKLSLSSAIFINLNIMMGAGLFISSVILCQKLGAASIFIYPLMGLLIFPLIHTLSKLINRYPKGGFYDFGKPISPFLGFISTWSYFMGKLASGSLMLYVACAILKNFFIPLQNVSTLLVSFFVLILFTIFNLHNIKVGASVQKIFFGAKLIPICFIIAAGFYFFDTSALIAENFHLYTIPFTIPLLIFCLCGFEAACSISRKIKNPKVNGPKAIYYSFGIVVAFYTLYQGLLYTLIHGNVNTLTSYQEIYPVVTYLLPCQTATQQWLASVLNFMSAISAIGGAYGIMFSNSWNLYTLAENKHLFFNKQFLILNRHQIPYFIILFESFIYMAYLIFTQGYQIPLQQTTAFGVTIAYMISALAMFLQEKTIEKMTVLAIIVCTGLIGTCLHSLIKHGISSLTLFAGIMIFGGLMFFYKKHQKDCS